MNILLRNGKYALIEREHEYVVAYNYDETQPENQQWDHGAYFTHWNQTKLDKQKALSGALECFRLKTEENYIHRHRLEELATKFKDGLLEDDEESAMEYFECECEMTEEEMEWFGITESEEM